MRTKDASLLHIVVTPVLDCLFADSGTMFICTMAEQLSNWNGISRSDACADGISICDCALTALTVNRGNAVEIPAATCS
jgi:hypothetical protein